MQQNVCFLTVTVTIRKWVQSIKFNQRQKNSIEEKTVKLKFFSPVEFLISNWLVLKESVDQTKLYLFTVSFTIWRSIRRKKVNRKKHSNCSFSPNKLLCLRLTFIRLCLQWARQSNCLFTIIVTIRKSIWRKSPIRDIGLNRGRKPQTKRFVSYWTIFLGRTSIWLCSR